MFSQNERLILAVLRKQRNAELPEISSSSGLARSSAHVALRHLVEVGVVETTGPKGTTYRLAPRDVVERAGKRMLAEFRNAVLAPDDGPTKPRLTFTDQYVLPAHMLDELSHLYEVKTFATSPEFMSDDLFRLRAQEAEVIVRFDGARVDQAFLDAMPSLRAIVMPNCFPPNIDFDACAQAGVLTKHADPDTEMYFAPTEVEYTINAVLTLLKPLYRASQAVARANRFHFGDHMGEELFGNRVGLIFKQMRLRPYVDIFRAFNCPVVAACTNDRPPPAASFGLNHYDPIQHVWETSDVVVFLGGSTLEIDELLSQPKVPRYLIIETDRVHFDIELMRSRILSGDIAGVALDYLPDMWRRGTHLLDLQQHFRPLINLPNVLVTPELQVFSRQSLERSYEQVFDALMSLELP